MSNTPLSPQIVPCHECAAGQMRLHNVTYYTWLVDELITVSDFPAWICDICGRREYDPRAVNQLSLILSPNAGKSPPRRRTVHKRRTTVKHKTPRARQND